MNLPDFSPLAPGTGPLARAASSTALLIGLGLATFGAMIWAGVFSVFPAIKRAVYPIFVGTNVAPKEVLAPLFIIWFGFSIFPKVLVAAGIAFFPTTR